MFSDPVTYEEVLKTYPVKVFSMDNREYGFDVLDEYVQHEFPLYRNSQYHIATRLLVSYLCKGHVGRIFESALNYFWGVINGFYDSFYGMKKIDVIKHKMKIEENEEDEYWESLYVKRSVVNFRFSEWGAVMAMKSNLQHLLKRMKRESLEIEKTHKHPIDFAVSKKTKDYWTWRYGDLIK